MLFTFQNKISCIHFTLNLVFYVPHRISPLSILFHLSCSPLLVYCSIPNCNEYNFFDFLNDFAFALNVCIYFPVPNQTKSNFVRYSYHLINISFVRSHLLNILISLVTFVSLICSYEYTAYVGTNFL